MVEVFFGIITRQAIHRGSFTSVKDLTAAIDGWNHHCHPFTWTKTVSDTLGHCKQIKGHHLRDTVSTGSVSGFCG